jgi:hypothetical protein
MRKIKKKVFTNGTAGKWDEISVKPRVYFSFPVKERKGGRERERK